MNSNMSDEAKIFLKKAIKSGKVYTCPIFPIGPIYPQTIKEVSITTSYGKPGTKKHITLLNQ